MSDLDEIRKRLDKLRDFNNSNQQNVTDDDLRERLNKLKGLNVTDGEMHKNPNYNIPTKFRTNVEQSSDLFEQLCDEVNIRNKFEQRCNEEDDQLYAKLSNLRTNNTTNQTSNNVSLDNPSVDSSVFDQHGSMFGFDDNFVSKAYRLNQENNKLFSREELAKELGAVKNQMKEFNYEFKDISKQTDKKIKSDNQLSSTNKITLENNQSIIRSGSSSEDDEYLNIVEKFVKEVELDKSTGFTSKDIAIGTNHSSNSPVHKEETDDLDFCYICNEDAVLDCKDCEDRFCLNCFKEFHQDPEYRGHRYSRFEAKK